MGYAEEVQKARAQMSHVGTVQGLAHATLRYLDLLHSPRMFLEELASKAFHEAREKHKIIGLWISSEPDEDPNEEILTCWVVFSDNAHIPISLTNDVESIIASFMYTKCLVRYVTPVEAANNDFFSAKRFALTLGEKPPVKSA